MRKLVVVLSIAVAAACSSSATPSTPFDGPAPQPVPSALGSLTIRLDTGAFVVGKHLRVVVNLADASGMPADASNTEVTSSNPAVAQFAGSTTVPVTTPPIPSLNALVATFDLKSAGSTAIRARLGIFTDSVVITVIPPN